MTGANSENPTRRNVTRRHLMMAAESSGSARRRAIQCVVEANIPVAQAVARRYAGRGLGDDELCQIAYVGLTAAAHRFDASMDKDFLAFAVPWMTGTIRRHFRDQTWMIRPPRRIQELHQELAHLENRIHGPASVAEAVESLGAPAAAIREVLCARQVQRARSIDHPAHRGLSRPLIEEIPAEETVGMRSADARLILGRAFWVLTARERHLLRRLYCDGWTQAEIGSELGLTQMSVSRIHCRALENLRAEIGVAA
jgi:RNA polymerase sigma-B factor